MKRLFSISLILLALMFHVKLYAGLNCDQSRDGQDCGAGYSVMSGLNCAPNTDVGDPNASSIASWDAYCTSLTNGGSASGVYCPGTNFDDAWNEPAMCDCNDGWQYRTATHLCDDCAEGYYKRENGTIECLQGTSIHWDNALQVFIGEEGLGTTSWTPIANLIAVDTDYYVDGSVGNDSNDGLTWVTAKRTFSFIDDLPHELKDDATLTINFRNTVYGGLVVEGFNGNGSVEVVGETTQEDTGTATGWDNTTTSITYHQYLTDTSKSWIVDEHKGRFLRITSGTGVSSVDYFPVLSNTADTLQTVLRNNLGIDSQYEIISVPEIRGSLEVTPTTPSVETYVINHNNVKEVILRNFNPTYSNGFVFGRATYNKFVSFENVWMYPYDVRVAQLVYFLHNNQSEIVGGLIEIVEGGAIFFGDGDRAHVQNFSTIGDTNNIGIFSSGVDNISLFISRIENHDEGIVDGEWNQVYFWLNGFNVFRNNNTAISTSLNSTVSICKNGFSPRVLNFATNTTALKVYGSQLTIGTDTQVNVFGGITEIQSGSTDTMTFANWIAGNIQSNAKSGSFFNRWSNLSKNHFLQDEFDNTIENRLIATTYQEAIDELSNENKEVFFPAGDYTADINIYRAKAVGPAGNENFTFSIPSDFNNLDSMHLIYIPNALAAGPGKDIDFYSNYASIGEDSQTHTESETTQTWTISTANFIGSFEIQQVFTNITAGDFCGVEVDHNNIGGTVYYLGIRLIYN